MFDEQSNLNLADTNHQLFPDWKNGTVGIAGRLAGAPYGATINVREHTVEWDSSLIGVDATRKRHSDAAARSPKNDKPAKGDCDGCLKGAARLIRGGWGWIKAELKIGAAEQVVAEERKAICVACPSKCYDFGVCRDDFPDREKDKQGCGCILSLKVLVESEKCPHGHWPR